MSVIVKGMKMPENCGMCDLAHRNFDGNETRLACYALKDWAEESGDDRRSDCPLVELPKNHGSLIDADELEKKCRLEIALLKLKLIKEEPTIFEAEG